MNRTEPIKDLLVIKKIGDILREENMRDYIMYRSFLHLGLRTGDILTLKVKDIRGKYKINFKEEKTNKTKIIEIHPNLIKDLEEYTEYMDDEDYLFPSQKRNKDGSQRSITREQAFRRLQRVGERVGVDLSGHVLRKTFCYYSYKNGTPISVLSELLNHSSEAVTRRYIGLNQENINKAYLAVDFG